MYQDAARVSRSRARDRSCIFERDRIPNASTMDADLHNGGTMYVSFYSEGAPLST